MAPMGVEAGEDSVRVLRVVSDDWPQGLAADAELIGMSHTHPHDPEQLLDLYLRELTAFRAPATVKQARVNLAPLVRFLQKRGLPPTALSRRLLLEYSSFLQGSCVIARSTVRKYVQAARRWWGWLHEEQRDLGLSEIAPPRMIELPPLTHTPVRAPTWAEMDAAIGELRSSLRLLAIVLRSTGLRVSQGLRLEWRDLDLQRSELTVRGELGKSAAERAGRTVPLAPALVEVLAAQPQEGAHVIAVGGRRTIGTRRMVAAWRAAGVADELWRGQSWHAFRKGFETELIAAGAHPLAVEVLLGHRLQGQLANYTDTRRMPLKEAVALVPPLRLRGSQLSLPGVL